MSTKQRFLIIPALVASLAFAPVGKAKSAGGQPPPAARGAAVGTSSGITPGASASDADIELAVPMFCPKREILRGKDGKISGCSRCPTGTDMYGTGVRTQWELRSGTMWGHFTSPSAENLIVSGYGCDSHAHNFGGSYMFTRRAGKLRLLKYDPALFVSDCHAFPYPDGRDFLVCKGGWFGMGEGSGFVFHVAFGATGEDRDTTLFNVKDTTGTCGSSRAQVVHSSDISNLKFSIKEDGELAGFTATLATTQCGQIADSQKSKTTAAPLKTYEIEYKFDGKLFHVTPGSRAALALFESD
ncbi:MAG: hypothetical protein WAM91_12805 [Candidatus Acidiferrales bacterium]